jgi:hypothetical protein
MRQVRPDHHQIARHEVADMVAHEVFARGGRDEVNLVLRVKMPAHRAIGIAMRPDLERLGNRHCDQFEIGLVQPGMAGIPVCHRVVRG